MNKASINNIEIGNLLFGHSRGSFVVPRERWQPSFHKFLEDCGFDASGHVIDDKLEKHLNIKVGREYHFIKKLRGSSRIVEIIKGGKLYEETPDGKVYTFNNTYYLIYETPSKMYYDACNKWDKQFDEYFDKLEEYADYLGLSEFPEDMDIPEDIVKLKPDKEPNPDDFPLLINAAEVKPYEYHIHYFDNGVFMVKPYEYGGSPELIAMPNFKYYPDDFELKWYKYSLRDSYCNKDITDSQFFDILQKCKDSL